MGTGLSWNAPRYWDWQVRIGYHGRGRHQPRCFAPAIQAARRDAGPTGRRRGPAKPRAGGRARPPPASRRRRTRLQLRPQPAQPAAPSSYIFEDVHFDLDGFTPSAEAISGLDAAARAMLANPTLNINIEGHTCDIGSAEYNMALGNRRANAVERLLLGRGISASRLRTASYGEEDPDHANAHEETRRLNRRVVLVVRLKP